MQSPLSAAIHRYGVDLPSSEDSVVEFGVGMATSVFAVYVNGLAYKNFWLVHAGFLPTQAGGFDAFGVAWACSVKGSFVFLESVSGIFVKLVNMNIGLLSTSRGPLKFLSSIQAPIFMPSGQSLPSIWLGKKVFIM